jgi:hypothetical protein
MGSFCNAIYAGEDGAPQSIVAASSASPAQRIAFIELPPVVPKEAMQAVGGNLELSRYLVPLAPPGACTRNATTAPSNPTAAAPDPILALDPGKYKRVACLDAAR